jgi:hypothetical protein
MARIDYGQLPAEKQERGLRIIFTSVRSYDRVRQFQNFKWVSNHLTNSKFKDVPGQTTVAQNTETGKWKVMFVCEKVK